MTDSLILADAFELLGGGVASAIPDCAGAVFRLAPGFDLSAAQPSTSVVESLILDGERPVGDRSSNRTPTLPIVILAPSRQILAAAREMLLRAVNQDYFTMQWTRDNSGLPLVFDCFRASATVFDYSIAKERSLVCNLAISFQSLPYGRNDQPVTVDFPSAIIGRSAPASPVTIDNYATVTGTHWSASANGPTGQAAHWSPGSPGIGALGTYTRSGLGPLNLTGLNGLAIWAGFGTELYFPNWGLRKAGPVQFAFTLTDGTHSVTTQFTRRIKTSASASSPVWQRIHVPIPQGSGLNLAAITGYTLRVSNRQQGDLLYTDLYIAGLTAVPFAGSAAAQPNSGTLADLSGIAGSARSAVSLVLSQAAGSIAQVTQKITNQGAGLWLAPFGTTWVAAQAVGGGGRGGVSTGANGSGGGAGAENAGDMIPVTPGGVYQFNVAAGSRSGGSPGGNTSFTGDGPVTVTGHGGASTPNGTQAGAAGSSSYTPRQMLTGVNSTFDGSIGNWVAVSNATIATTTAQHHGGTGSMQVTSVAAGDMSAGSCSAATYAINGCPCSPVMQVTVTGWFRAQATGRQCSIGAEFFDVSGNSLGTLFGSAVTSVTTAFTQASATLTPPAGSAYYRVRVKVAATAGASEVHYADDVVPASGYANAGGSGAAGTTGGIGGGGGGAGGVTGAGGNGSGAAPGAAGTGSPPGQAGGQGGLFGPAGSGNRAGGGGGGTDSGYATAAHGGDGQLNLTYSQTTPFKTLVLHRPRPGAPDDFCPFVPVPTGDTPNGNTEYFVPSLISGQPARFAGTYSIIAVAAAWNNPTASRTITITVNHYEQQDSTVYTQSINRSVTPSNLASQMVLLGELTLPDHALPDDNTSSYFTITVTSANTSDSFQDVLFLDTMGSSIMIESPTAYVNYYIDEPPTDRDVGNVMASQLDRTAAVSVLAYTTALSGPPIYVSPEGNQSLLVYSVEGPPAAQLIHYPRWLQERLS